MPVVGALLRLMLYVLCALLAQGVAALAVMRLGVSPWWSLLLMPLALLAWGAWRLCARLWRRLARRPRGGTAGTRVPKLAQVPSNASLAQAWQRALQRSGHGVRTADLPWFLLLGRRGSGKTTALTRARIPSPLSPVRSEYAEAPGLAWWFTDRLVVMDCGDALPGGEDDPALAADWQFHLRMLRRHRRHQGIEGVVLTLSARQLLDVDADTLGNEARAMRLRLDELIAATGERFPVYVLLTHCDAVYGFEAWTDLLPDECLRQALGYLAEPDAADQDFIRNAFDALDERLTRLRWQLLTEGHAGTPELLMFPRELQQLRAPLQTFADNCLATHPYLERLLLRGLFFSSAMQPGGAASQFLEHDLGRAAAHSERHQGLFLRGVFADVLPAERGLRRPSAAVLRRRARRTRALLGSWLILLALAAGALSASFMRNLRALEDLHTAEGRFDGARAGTIAPVPALVARQEAIRRFETRTEGALARLTLPGSGWEEMLARQKREFVQACAARLDARGEPADDGLAADADPGTRQAAAVLRLLRLSAVLQARANGAKLPELQTFPPPYASQVDDAGGRTDTPDTLWQLELSRIAWTSANDSRQRSRLLRTRARLDRLAMQDPQLAWLEQVPQLDGVAPLRSAQAWEHAALRVDPGQALRPGLPALAPEFTAAGYASMERLVHEWRAVSAEPTRVDAAWSRFRAAWRQRQELAVRTVLEQALTTPPPLHGAAQWRAALPDLASADNPYWKFNDELLRQMEAGGDRPDAPAPTASTAPGAPADGGAPAPVWWLAARELSLWRSAIGGEPTGSGALEALRSLGSRTLQKAAQADAAGAARSLEQPIRGARELRDYLKALDTMARRLEQGDAQATSVAAEFLAFGNDPKVTASVAADAANALQLLRDRLRNTVAQAARSGGEAGTQTATADVFPIDALLEAPWRALMQYADTIAACNLQQRWQAEVLWPLRTAASREDMLRQLYGPQGTLWTFVDGPAAPFLRRDASLYRAARRADLQVPFTPEFLSALNGAAQRRAEQSRQEAQSQQVQASLQATQQRLDLAQKALLAAQQAGAVVSITALPSDVQPDSAPKVFSTSLVVACAAGTAQLDNLNLPQQRSIEWSPQSCSGVRLRIAVGNLLLERQYPGALGFADFLAEFSNGTHAFTPEDFPAQAPALRRMGLRKIILHYRFDGADAALRAARTLRQSQQDEQRIQDTLRRLQGLTAGPTPAAAPGATLPRIDGAALSPAQSLPLSALGLPASIAACWGDPPGAQP